MSTRNLVPLSLVALLLAGSVTAQESPSDDRALLYARGAPANVLLFVDSAATMVNDPETSVAPLMLNGDDPGSKLYQAKDVLNTFFDFFPDFNMGFSFFEKQDLELHYLTHVYQITAIDDGAGTTLASMHGGEIVGSFVRVGASYDPNHNKAAVPQYPILFGPDGSDTTLVYAPGVNPAKPADGDIRFVSCLLDSSGLCKTTAGPPYYKPAYNWGSNSGTDGLSFDRWVRMALEGDKTWAEVATHNGITLDADGAWEVTVHDFVLADIMYRGDPWCVLDSSCSAGETTLASWIAAREAAGASNQIGADTLRYKQWKETYVGGKVKAWVADAAAGERYATMSYFDHFLLYDRDPDDGDDSQLSAAGDTLTAVSWHSPGADCEGYAPSDPTDNSDVRPLVQIPPDGDNSTRAKIKSYFGPQKSMQFYFPTNSADNEFGTKYFPARRSQFIPRTETVVAAGRRPVKKVIDEAADYFEDYVLNRDDEFWMCRKHFIILITDGIETCSDPSPICTGGHAGRLVDLPVVVNGGEVGVTTVSVFVVGFGLADGTNVETLECIAEMTDGWYREANNAQELLETLARIGREIEERTRGFSSPVVPSVQSSTEQTAYIATFEPRGDRSIWRGNLRAYPVINGSIPTLDTGAPDTSEAFWNLGEVLEDVDADSRVFYYGGDSGSAIPAERYDFDVPTTGSTEETRLLGLVGAANTTMLAESIDFIRGDRDAVLGETIYEDWKLGDIFHSRPAISGAPSCFTCYLSNQNASLSANGVDKSYRAFRDLHRKRRQVLFFGANDGAFHAIDAGVWIDDTTLNKYHTGTGEELFSWVPRSVMPKFPALRTGIEHLWTVDGSPTIADVYVDPIVPLDGDGNLAPSSADRQWRTLLVFGQRRGGKSYVALDITKPDTYNNSGLPSVMAPGVVVPSNFDPTPTCVDDADSSDGLEPGECFGDWPSFLWEFTDTSDQDGNGFNDLGYTWSQPLVGFVKVNNGTADEDRSVAIFGGGYDFSNGDGSYRSGNFIYMVDLETGKILFKENASGMVPAQVAALDLDLNGFFDRIYYGTTAGTIRRLDLETPGTLNASTGRVTSWSSTTFFDAGSAQPFFLEPKLVPVSFSGTGEVQIAVVIGSGRRDNIFFRNPTPNRFYAILDTWNGTGATPDTLTEANLQPITLADENASAGTNYLYGDPDVRGWYLILGAEEKVNTAALVFDQNVIFSTFTPSETVIVTDEGNCRLNGGARTYVVSLTAADAVGDSRGTLHLGNVVYATEPVLYAGNDGKIHVSQALDNQELHEPIGAEAIPLRVFSWKED